MNNTSKNTSYPDDVIAQLLLAVQKINPTITAKHLGQQDIFSAPITTEYPQSVELPNLLNTPPPDYSIGTKVRLIPIDDATEWGTIIGNYLCYAEHHCKWQWKYILFLDFDSPSADWVKTTFAWQDEIECLLGEK